jgi:putative transcriptional regulator
MSIHHHLSDTTLAAFTAGTLIESISLVGASHLSICPDCIKRRDQLENIGGIQLQHAEPADMSPDSLKKAMIKLGNQEAPLVSHPAKNSILSSSVGNAYLGSHSEIPKPIRAHVPDRLEDVDWKSIAPGIKYFGLAGLKTADGSIGLLKIAPGVNIPEHGHQGIELTYVLKGSFSDEIGRFGVGDIADLDGDIEHQPIADSNEACICLIATEAPLKFNGLMPRMVQYYSRM